MPTCSLTVQYNKLNFHKNPLKFQLYIQKTVYLCLVIYSYLRCIIKVLVCVRNQKTLKTWYQAWCLMGELLELDVRNAVSRLRMSFVFPAVDESPPRRWLLVANTFNVILFICVPSSSLSFTTNLYNRFLFLYFIY